MTVDVAALRPHGIKRKVLQSDIMDLSTAGDHPAILMPHGGHLLGMWIVVTSAFTNANETIDIGTSKDGDDIIDGATIQYSGSAVGDVLDIFQDKGSNGGLIDIPANTVIWLQTAGASSNGKGYLVIEYEDNTN